MEDDQQFCLRWNNHQSTLIQNFDTLLESGTLVDCTLAAEGKTLKAHKVVLSACSPYFECLLSEHYDKHPVFILKDVKFKELKAMMDYMYRGEVNISQDQLAALLKAAESLQIKGLSESKTSTTGSNKMESRSQKTVSQPIARVSPSLDIPHASSGLTIEKNKVPRQSMAQVGPVGDIPEDSASPQGSSKRLCSREGSQSPTTRKRKRFRRSSLGEDNLLENQDASNSSDMPQQMGVPALGIAPVADEKVHADSTDTLGRSTLMTQLTKPADEMLQVPLEKPEPNDNLIEPKSEYLDESEECVEDLTLDDDMNDLNDIEQDNNRAGPSHDPTQHSTSLGAWHVTGDRSNAGGVVGTVAGATGATDEVFLAAQEAAVQQQQAQRDSQERGKREVKKQRLQKGRLLKKGKGKNKDRGCVKIDFTNGENTESSSSSSTIIMIDASENTTSSLLMSAPGPSTSTAPGPSTSVAQGPSTSTARDSLAMSSPSSTVSPSSPLLSTNRRRNLPRISKVVSLNNSQTESDSTESWTDAKNVATQKFKCPYCNTVYNKRAHLSKHIRVTCLMNPDSLNNKETGKFRCTVCGRTYREAKALRYHQKHECQKKITCPDCGAVMTGSYITERHKQKHCIKKNARRSKIKSELKKEPSPDELFIDDASDEF